MRKSKYTYYVFSVYSSVLGNYPYYPFISKDIKGGIFKFIKFISNRDSICEGAELHVIGTCDIHDSNSCNFENIQPYIIPQKVEIKNNVFSKLIVLGMCYLNTFNKYLRTLNERKNYGKKC